MSGVTKLDGIFGQQLEYRDNPYTNTPPILTPITGGFTSTGSINPIITQFLHVPAALLWMDYSSIILVWLE